MMTTFHTTTRSFGLAAFLLLCQHSVAQESGVVGAQKADEIRAAVQKICPVSGLELGAHGPPIKAKIGGQILFLCCDGCKSGKVKKEHWNAIHQNFAKAQAKCFVMDNPLPKKPKWVIVKGQLIYVCCPPCIEDIKESPDKYLEQLAKTQANYLKSKTTTTAANENAGRTQ